MEENTNNNRGILQQELMLDIDNDDIFQSDTSPVAGPGKAGPGKAGPGIAAPPSKYRKRT